MSQFGYSTIVAIIIGAVLAVLAFIPTVAVRYRRAGTFRFIDIVLLLLVAIYGVALWTYTLIPLPESMNYRCVGSNFLPLAFINDIRDDPATSLLHNRALFQVVFNVIFFMPLGFFVRTLTRWKWVVAAIVGLIISTLIETTQLTGIWGMYPCAFRTFDIDDLITNTLGALIGALAAVPFALIFGGRRKPVVATVVSFGRRLLGVLIDLMLIMFVGVVIFIAWVGALYYLVGLPTSEMGANIPIDAIIVLPLVIEVFCVLILGQTVGEVVVGIRPAVEGLKAVWQRPLKAIFGVGGMYVSDFLGDIYGLWIPGIFILVSVICLFTPRDRRGLTGLITGSKMVIAKGKSRTPGLD
ncbi:MAG: VanZ family protein [Propionibacteriaceae bacterium]|jgi:glycopeptide antibiotics resistance protein|nr:VanZ family protein [Propionibacteriaceae bacterium]